MAASRLIVVFAIMCQFARFSLSEFQLSCQISGDEASATTANTSSSSVGVVRGIPGKQGPRGPPGDVIRCNCGDYSDLQRRVEKLERMNHDLNERVECGGLVYGSYCIRLLYTAGNVITHTRAAELCASRGGKLLDIETDDMFVKVFDYVQREWNTHVANPEWDYVNVWLASRYLGGKIVLSSGTSLDPSALGFWYRGFPVANDQSYMILLVPQSPERVADGRQGFLNKLCNHPDVVPICQYNLGQ